MPLKYAATFMSLILGSVTVQVSVTVLLIFTLRLRTSPPTVTASSCPLAPTAQSN